MLVDDLHNYHQQFQAIKTEAQVLLRELSQLQFYFQPNPSQWSIAHCIDHLLVTGRNSISNIHFAISDARRNNLLSLGPFRYRLIEKWFVHMMDAPPKIKMKTPRVYSPILDRSFNEIISSFFILQEEFLQCIEETNGIDLSRVKVNNPVSKWIRFSLGQEIAFNAAHERRHLWQARLVKECRNFPHETTAI
jgi:hypothetical protein